MATVLASTVVFLTREWIEGAWQDYHQIHREIGAQTVLPTCRGAEKDMQETERGAQTVSACREAETDMQATERGEQTVLPACREAETDMQDHKEADR